MPNPLYTRKRTKLCLLVYILKIRGKQHGKKKAYFRGTFGKKIG